MKTIFTQFLVLGFVFFTFFAEGQVFERTFHPDLFSHANDVSPNGLGGWYVVGHQGMGDWTGLDYVLNLDVQGNVLWEKSTVWAEVVHAKKISLLSNNDFVITGEIGLCDVGPMYYSTQISATGDTVWQSSYFGSHFLGYNNANVIEKSNGQFASLGPDAHIYRYNASGQQVSYNSNGVYWDLVSLSNDLSVGLAPNKELILLNNNDNNIGTYTFLQPIERLKSFNDTISIISNSKIYTFDNQLNNIAIYDFLGHFSEVIDYEVRGDGYQILGKQQNQYRLKFFNAAGTLLQTINFDAKREPNAISRQGKILALVGNEKSDDIHATGVFMMEGSRNIFVQTFHIDLQANNSLDVDIEVLGIEADSLHQQPDYCMVTGSTNFKKVKWSGLRVLIKNNGTTPLDYFQLQGKKWQGCGYGCGFNGLAYKNKLVENLNLQPGDSTYILIGDWEIFAQENTANQEICFWATVPNQKMDDNLNNNLACLTMIATNSNEVLTEQTHRIFPNPTDGFMNIEFENSTKIETIKVINQIGQIVDNQIINTEFLNYKMDISHLPKGIYFVEIMTENGRSITKIIKH